uniref:Uncharacterized protein n=1 Tax=Anguilla anguilla TaxID=7936 RepID=A0A0E9V2N7_ANGAN
MISTDYVYQFRLVLVSFNTDYS